MRDGPTRAHSGREKLRRDLMRFEELGDSALYGKASEAATRSDHRHSDFLDKDGKLIDHPAEKFSDGLKSLSESLHEIRRLDGVIDALPADKRKELKQELDDASAVLMGLVDPDDVAQVGVAVQKVRTAIAAADPKLGEAALAAAPLRVDSSWGANLSLAFGSDALLEASRVRSAERMRSASELPDNSRRVRGLGLMGYRILTGIAVVTVVAWALFSLWQGVYEPKPAFGSTDDYLALLVAAIASGAAGGVLGFLAIWDPYHPSAEA